MVEKKGGFSSAVLNMKFMKAAKMKAEEKEVKEEDTKLRDLSEWKTTTAESLKQKASSRPKIISLGYTSINNLSSSAPVVGRRTFGAKPEEKEEKKSNDENDIDSLWKKQKEGAENGGKDSKRAREGSPKKLGNKKRRSHPPASESLVS